MSITKGLKWTCLILAGILVLTALSTTGMYFFLRSGEWTQEIVPQAAPYLKPFGVNLKKLESAKIDLLRSIKIRDFEIVWHNSNIGDVELVGEYLELDFSLTSLLSGLLRIDQFYSENININTNLRLTSSDSKDVDGEPNQWINGKNIEQLLSKPPLELDIQELILSNVTLDVNIEQNEQTIAYKGKLDHTKIDLIWQAYKTQGQIQFEALDENNLLTLVLAIQNEVFQFTLSPTINMNIDWQLENSNNRWTLSKLKFEDQLNLNKINIQRELHNRFHTVGEINSIRIANSGITHSIFQGKYESDVNASGDDYDATHRRNNKGMNSMFPVEIDHIITSTTSGLSFNDLHYSDIKLNLRADHSLKLNITNGPSKKEQSVNGIEFKLDQNVSVSQADIKVNDFGTELLKANWRLSTTGEIPNSLEARTVSVNLNSSGNARGVSISRASGDYLQADMVPEWKVSGTGIINSLNKPFESLVMELYPQLTASKISAKLAKDDLINRYSIESQTLEAKCIVNQQNLDIESDIILKDIKLSGADNKFSLNNRILVHADNKLEYTKLELVSSLNGIKTLNLNVTSNNQPKKYRLQHTVSFQQPPNLEEYLPNIPILDRVGVSTLDATGQNSINHNYDNWWDIDLNKLSSLAIQGKGQIKITQSSPPRDKSEGILLSQPLMVKYTVKNSNVYEIDLDLKTTGIQFSPLINSIPVAAKVKSKFTWPLSHSHSIGDIYVDKDRILNYKIDLFDEYRKMSVNSAVLLSIPPQLHKYLDKDIGLANFGKIEGNFQIEGQVDHTYNTILDYDHRQIRQHNIRVNIDSQISQSDATSESMVRLHKPILMEQQITWSGQEINWKNKFSAASLENLNQLKVENLAGWYQVSVTPNELINSADVTLKIDRSTAYLLGINEKSTPLEIGGILTPIELNMAASLQKEIVKLRDFTFYAGKELLSMKAKGTSSYDGNKMQLDSVLKASIPPNTLEQLPVSGHGRIEMPWRIIFDDKRHLTVDGSLKFEDFGLHMTPYHILGINGQIKIEEELLLKDKSVMEFRYLVRADPFQRVDFTRIQPYLDAPNIKIKEFVFSDILAGPALATVLIRQNMFRLQHFDLEIFDGHLSGQFYIDATPGAWKLGLLGRVTQLDARKLLDPQLAQDSSHSPINARVAAEFNVSQRLLEGRIDITEINSIQMLQLLDIVDPDNSDEDLSKIRRALRVAYPEFVTVNMQHGLMDLSVKVSALSKPIRVSGLPLTPLIQHFAGETLEYLEQTPLLDIIVRTKNDEN